MAAKRHMDIKRNITGHNMIIADITGYSLKRLCIRRQGGLLPNSIELEIHDKIEMGCLTTTGEEATYDGETHLLLISITNSLLIVSFLKIIFSVRSQQPSISPPFTSSSDPRCPHAPLDNRLGLT